MRYYLIFIITIVIPLICPSNSGAGFWDIFKVDRGSIAIGTDNVRINADFGYEDKRHIRRYYSHKRRGKGKKKGLPPGLAKKGYSHPGLQRHLRTGEHLPPGLERHALPDELERKLSKLPKGHIRVKVGGDIAILNQETDVVIDVVRDIE